MKDTAVIWLPCASPDGTPGYWYHSYDPKTNTLGPPVRFL